MSATLQRRKRFERGMTVFVIAALLASLLPVPVSAASTVAQPARQTNQLADTPLVPVPPPAPQWPEAGAVAPYMAETASLPAPGVLAQAPRAPVTSATESVVAAAPVLPEFVLPQGPVEFALGDNAGAAGTTALPLTLQAAGSTPGAALTAQVRMLDKTLAEGLSPLGFAFALQLQDDSPAAASAAASQLPPASQALTLTIDYSRLPRAQVGDVGGRLALYRATGCAQTAADLAAGTASDIEEPEAVSSVTCTQWEKLPTHNDYAAQLLTGTLPDVKIVAAATEPPLPSANEPASSAATSITATVPAAAPANNAGVRLFLPRIVAPDDIADAPALPQDTGRSAAQLYLPAITRSQTPAPAADSLGEIPDTLIVLATSTSGPDGDYSATPLNAVSDYQTDLFAGTFATSYPIAVPPAAAGAAPAVSLVYNSGIVEGQSSDRNNQPGFAGSGWELNTGAITRIFKACEPTKQGGSASGLCTAGAAYVLTLNGVSSRLVKQSGNLYRMQDDPAWQVQQLTTTVAAHPDQYKQYWLVTTPDGTQYRFGGEIEPETGADQNSVYYVSISGAPYSNVWRWNLDRVEDTNGNVASYFYTLEVSTFAYPYVRAGQLSRIEYSKRSGQITQPHARVLFNRELRCLDPTTATGCDDSTDLYDVPADLDCATSCTQNAPSFWSYYRLGSIQPQIYETTSGQWRTTALYDLTYSALEGIYNNKKTVLTAITQRPGGDYLRSAFSQIQAESYDQLSGILTAVDAAYSQRDFDRTPYMYGGSPTGSPYLVYRGINFDTGAGQVLLRYVSGTYGGVQLELRLDSPTGTKIGEVTAPYHVPLATVAVSLSGANGVHDLYIVFKQARVYLNWFRFLPASSLAGLPPVSYSYTWLPNSYLGTTNLLPRLSRIDNELGGSVQITYGQTHTAECGISGLANYGVRSQSDCYPVYDPTLDAGGPAQEFYYRVWRRWKVLKLEKWDSFSLNPSEVYTYTYSAPIWRYSDDPTKLDIRTPCPGGPGTCNKRHWNEFRGHERVTVTDNSGAATEYRFYRGMDGDLLSPTGGVYSATVTLSDGSTRSDSNWYAGKPFEVRRLNAGAAARTRSVYWYAGTLTAGTVITGSYFTGATKAEATTYGAGTDAAGTHTTRTETAYDAYGNVTRQVLHGDIATPDDDRNVETGYAYNATTYIVDEPQWQKLWEGTTSGSAGAEQAFSEYLYDDATVVGTPPLKGNLTGTRSYWQATPSYAYVTSSTSYDSYGRPLTVSDGRGNSTTTSYDPFYGYAASVTNALGHVTSNVVDPRWGVPTQTTDGNGHVTTLQYDGYGRLAAVWLPTEPTSGPASYLFGYDAAARPARVQSRRLQDGGSGTYRESWQYVDGFGRTLQTQQLTATGSRVVNSQQYDGQGQLLHQSAAYELAGAAGSGYVAPDWTTVASYHRFGYNELGNQWLDETRSQNSVLWSTTTVHDGWQRRQYDPNGRRTDYDADAFGNLDQVVEYNSASAGTTAVYTTTYSYNLARALAQVMDAAGNVTSMAYDLLGRKTAMTDPDMGQWQYQYDAAGNLAAQRDGRGLWLYLGYDELNRLTSKRQDDPVSGSLLADYSYDAPGQLGLPSRSRAYSAAGVVEVQAVAYDSRGQVTQQQWVVPGSGGGTFRLDTAYNAAGQKAALTYPGGSGGQLGEVVSFGYDAIGQLTSVGGAAVQYLSGATYNAQGQPLELVNDSGANGLRRQYAYESNTQRLSVLRAGKASPYTDLQELTYGYDNAGNVTSIVDGRNSSQRQCFQYDWLDRLTGAFTGDAACSAYSGVGVGAYSHSYGYDAIGNLTSYAGSSYTYGATNDQPHAVTGAYGNSYGYDANGNQVRRTIAGVEYTLVYDYENRLVTVQQGEATIASFLYDAQGSRVKGTVAGVSTVYIAGVYEQSGSASTSYYEGGAMRRAGYAESNGVFYLLTDQLKSTSVIADQAGVEAARQFFYPYGGNRGGAAFSELTTKRFTGQYHEQGLPGAEGLSYYNARWYDSQLGRFTSPDTIVPKPDSPQAINRYSYGYNNPLKYDDPSGHCPRPPDDMGTTICLALFIKPETVNAGLWQLHGDNRDFQPDSDPAASRGYVWISLDTGKIQTHMNPSGYVTGYTYKPRYDKANDVWLNDVDLSYTFHEPSPKNHWSVTRQKGGQITIQYDLVVSGPLDKTGTAPHIDGTVSFRPQKNGRVNYSFARDGFPWAEAYLYSPNKATNSTHQGTWQTIFQDPAVRGLPYDLFGIERYRAGELKSLLTPITNYVHPFISRRYSFVE